jgi:hypothetical protein
MTSSDQTEIDSARRVADQLMETSAGRQALLALDKALTLVKRECGINDDNSDEVPFVQKALNAALTEIHAAIGADKAVLRQVVGFALDKPRASDAEVERVLSGIAADPDATSEPQRRIVRAMTMRAVTALGLLASARADACLSGGVRNAAVNSRAVADPQFKVLSACELKFGVSIIGRREVRGEPACRPNAGLSD